MNQTNQAILTELQLSNYQQKQLITQKDAAEKTDKEDVIKGIVSIKEYDGDWFTFNLAEVFRRLKRIFGKK